MVRLSSVLISAFLLMMSGTVVSNEFSQCIACHGKNGEGNKMLNAPALAGLSKDYIARQLSHFSSGIRGGHAQDQIGSQMAAIAKALDQKQINTVAQHIESLPLREKENETFDQSLAAKGQKLFVSNCGACHGNQAKGNPALKAPNLSNLDSQYLERQISNFRNGRRGAQSEDKYGKQMAMMAKTLADKNAIDAVIEYIKSL